MAPYDPADDRDERSTIDEFFFTHEDQFGDNPSATSDGVVAPTGPVDNRGGSGSKSSPGFSGSQNADSGGNGGSGNLGRVGGSSSGGRSSGGGSGLRGSPPLGGAWARPARKWEPNLGFPAFAPGSHGDAGHGDEGHGDDSHAGRSSADDRVGDGSGGEGRSVASSGSGGSASRLPRTPLEAGVDKARRSRSRSPRKNHPTGSPRGSLTSRQDTATTTTAAAARVSSQRSSAPSSRSTGEAMSARNEIPQFAARRSLLEARSARRGTFSDGDSRFSGSDDDSGSNRGGGSSGGGSGDSRLAARRRAQARRQRQHASHESSPRRAVALAQSGKAVTSEDMVVALEDYR
jgi:hypothetical protein